MMSQLLAGVTYLHSELGLVHTDLKPANIFVQTQTEQPTFKIGDFGECLSTTAGLESSADRLYVTTRWYRAPEVFLGSKLSSTIDLWAVGCIVGQYIKGSVLFAAAGPSDMMSLFVRMIGPPSQTIIEKSDSTVAETLFCDVAGERSFQPLPAGWVQEKEPGSDTWRYLNTVTLDTQVQRPRFAAQYSGCSLESLCPDYCPAPSGWTCIISKSKWPDHVYFRHEQSGECQWCMPGGHKMIEMFQHTWGNHFMAIEECKTLFGNLSSLLSWEPTARHAALPGLHDTVDVLRAELSRTKQMHHASLEREQASLLREIHLRTRFGASRFIDGALGAGVLDNDSTDDDDYY